MLDVLVMEAGGAGSVLGCRSGEIGGDDEDDGVGDEKPEGGVPEERRERDMEERGIEERERDDQD